MGYQKKQEEHSLPPEQLEQMDSQIKLLGWLSLCTPTGWAWLLHLTTVRIWKFSCKRASASSASLYMWSPRVTWLRTYGRQFASPRSRCLLRRHLLDALILDHKLLFADCFHKYWSLRARLTYKLFFWILLILHTIFRPLCQITMKRDFFK